MLINRLLCASGIFFLFMLLPVAAHASTGELFYAIPQAAFAMFVFSLCLFLYSINWCLDKFGRGLTRILVMFAALILSLFVSYMAALLTVVEWWGNIEYFGNVLRLAPVLIAIRWILKSRSAGQKWLRNISKGIFLVMLCWVVFYSYLTIDKFFWGMDYSKDFEWFSFIPGLVFTWWLFIHDFKLFMAQRTVAADNRAGMGG